MQGTSLYSLITQIKHEIKTRSSIDQARHEISEPHSAKSRQAKAKAESSVQRTHIYIMYALRSRAHLAPRRSYVARRRPPLRLISSVPRLPSEHVLEPCGALGLVPRQVLLEGDRHVLRRGHRGIVRRDGDLLMGP